MSLRITFTAVIVALTAAITCSTALAATPLDFEAAANYTLGQACSVEKANPNNPKAQKGFRFGYLEAYGFFARAYNRSGGQPPLVSARKAYARACKPQFGPVALEAACRRYNFARARKKLSRLQKKYSRKALVGDIRDMSFNGGAAGAFDNVSGGLGRIYRQTKKSGECVPVWPLEKYEKPGPQPVPAPTPQPTPEPQPAPQPAPEPPPAPQPVQ